METGRSSPRGSQATSAAIQTNSLCHGRQLPHLRLQRRCQTEERPSVASYVDALNSAVCCPHFFIEHRPLFSDQFSGQSPNVVPSDRCKIFFYVPLPPTANDYSSIPTPAVLMARFRDKLALASVAVVYAQRDGATSCPCVSITRAAKPI